ncbi:M12 family metallopeptidase [Sphaerisporangium sp. NPDC088356]|uniref:M12 family metallopeptidase n=1 Tax=Sphaerisporangium sp. NPDC088356 TaxID=3154871 RepID=UPI003444F8C9
MRYIAVLAVTLFAVAMGASPAAAEEDPFDPLWEQQTGRPSFSITTPDITGQSHTIEYVDIDGHAVTEGDIVIGTPSDAASGKLQMPGIFPNAIYNTPPRQETPSSDPPTRPGDCRMPVGAATTQTGALWPDRKVPYVLAPELPAGAREAVAQAMRDFHDNTCVRFVPRTNEAGFLNIFPGNGCYSYVGRIGPEPQDVSIGRGCERKGIAIHELLHAIGFLHEHSRSDRDSALTVHLENVAKGYESQFQRLTPPQNRLFSPLDYGSVMLYGRRFFSRNGKDTLVPTSDVRIGQRIGFSPADLDAVRALYGCP